MTEPSAAGPTAAGERASLARGASLSFVGAATSAVLGFLLIFLTARFAGAYGAGVLVQVIGVFTIVTVLTKLGMDSAALWLIPRYLLGRTAHVRSLIRFVVLVAAIAGVLAALAVALGAALMTRLSGPAAAGDVAGDATRAVVAVAWALPAGAVLLVLLAVARALGAVRPFVLLGNIALPALRVVIVLAAVVLGSSTVLIAQAWVAPLVPVLLALWWVVHRRLRRLETDQQSRAAQHDQDRAAGEVTRFPPAADRAQVVRFAAPRSVSAVLEQGLVWAHVLLVGAIAGTAAAGIYGSATRFIAAGLIIDTAIRLIVSPRFSALLHEERMEQVQQLYRTATGWLVLFATPAFLLLALFAPTVLRWLGPDFDEGAPALAVLAGGALITFLAGNIHSVLLMSGHSGWAAINKAVALSVCVAGCLVLIPVYGMVGAALAWAAATLVDAAMAAVQVRRLVGVRPEVAAALTSLAVAVIAVLPAVPVRWFWGEGTLPFLAATVLALVAFGVLCVLLRNRLQLADVRRGAGQAGGGPALP